MDNTIELAQKRFVELSEIIRQANEVREEWHELRLFLQSAERVHGQLKPSDPARFLPEIQLDLPPTSTTVFVKRTEKSAELAEYVFRNDGPQLHVNRVVELMKVNGWIGSGDTRKDYKNIHQLLATNPKRFRSLGKGVFERTQKAKARKIQS